MVPSISSELHPFSVFDYTPESDQQLASGNGRKARASTFSSVKSMNWQSPLGLRTSTHAPSLDEKVLHTPLEDDITVAMDVESPRDRSPSPPAPHRSVVRGREQPAGSSPPVPARRSVAFRRGLEDINSLLSQDDAESAAATYSQVFISPAGNWTRKLSDNVQMWSKSGAWVAPCWVQGPFLSPFSSAVSHGRLMLVASGIGLSAALPLVLQMTTCEREVYLVWITRSLEQLAYHLPLLTNCSACFVYYTGKEKVSDQVASIIAEYPHIGLYQGRPKLDAILAWLVSQRTPAVQSVLRGMNSPGRIRRGSMSARRLVSIPEPAPTSSSQSFGRSMLRAARISRERDTPRVAPSEMIATQTHAQDAEAEDEVKLKLPPQSVMGSVLDDIDVGRVQELCRSELHKDESWCVLYCGAVPVIRAALTSACTKSRFHYAEESFNW